MKYVLYALVVLWQVEMAVQCGIAASQRPTKARPVAPPPPTPPDARSVIVRPQPPLSKCEKESCPKPQPQPQVLRHQPVIIR